MWVKRLSLTNFRGFAKLELDLDRPLTVLVGINGAGKTSVLRALAASQSGFLAHFTQFSALYAQVLVDDHDVQVGATHAQIRSVLRHRSFESDALGYSKDGGWNFEASPPTLAESIGEYGSPFPLMFFVGVDRALDSADVRLTQEAAARRVKEDLGATLPTSGYARFLEWFKEREDVENEKRVAARSFELEDPQLRAVREAVAALVPGFEQLRIRRDPHPAMVVTKGATELRLDQLSDGERGLIALAGDLARRLVAANPTSTDPRQTEAVFLIDEVEQHLHPALQRAVIPALQRAFPAAQLIVTTHSPQVLSSVPAESVVVLDGFEARTLSEPTKGRDTNAILQEVFGVPARPQEQAEEARAIAALIEREQLAEARARLAKLAALLSEHDDAVLHLRTQLDFAEAGL